MGRLAALQFRRYLEVPKHRWEKDLNSKSLYYTRWVCSRCGAIDKITSGDKSPANQLRINGLDCAQTLFIKVHNS